MHVEWFANIEHLSKEMEKERKKEDKMLPIRSENVSIVPWRFPCHL